MKKLKTAVIGIGNMGGTHARCIAQNDIKGLELVAICDIDSKKTDLFAKEYPNINVFYDYEELIKAKAVDCIIIAVPHNLHTEIAIKAFENGIHVLVEKPVDVSVSKALKLNQIAEKSGKVFSIMFNQRTNPLYKKTRDIVKSGQLGEIKRTIWIITNWFRTQEYYDSGDWRATWKGEGGGVLINQAPHNLDLWQWICGMPKSVRAYCKIGKYHDIEVEDDVTILTEYENGATGMFVVSTAEYPGTNRLEISGEMGKLVLENGTLKLWKLKEKVSDVIANSKENYAPIESEYEEFTAHDYNTGHKEVLQNFANAILYGEQLIASGTDGIYELTISNAAYLSNWQDNKEIKIPFNADEFDKLLCDFISKSSDNVVKKSRFKKDIDTTSYSERWQVKW